MVLNGHPALQYVVHLRFEVHRYDDFLRRLSLVINDNPLMLSGHSMIQ
jgi:hypothetical protein